MLLRPLSLTTLVVTFATACAGSVDACFLTDWLYGRRAVPYAAGYTPIYSSGFTPVTSAPVQPPILSSGAFQVQRPAYFANTLTYNNPSVFTGAPVTAPVTASRLPLGATSAGLAPVTAPQPVGLVPSANTLPLRGTAFNAAAATNLFPAAQPTTAAVVCPNSSYYRANFQGVPAGLQGVPAGLQGVPAGQPAAVAAATPVAPLFPAAPRTPIRSGLSRFFGSLFGTNYRSSYVSTPVTYYRPVTSIDPTLGTTVTVQRPCISTVNQLQRTPYSSLLQSNPVVGQVPQTFSPVGQPGCGPAFNSIGQVGAVGGPATGQFTTPIPSTIPSVGAPAFPSSPNSAPLSGSPQFPQSQSDLSPVEQPSLRSFQRQPSETSFRESAPGNSSPVRSPDPPTPTDTETTEESYWKLQDSEDSTAMITPSRRYRGGQNLTSTPSTRQAPPFTGIRPIKALEEEYGSALPNQRRVPRSLHPDHTRQPEPARVPAAWVPAGRSVSFHERSGYRPDNKLDDASGVAVRQATFAQPNSSETRSQSLAPRRQFTPRQPATRLRFEQRDNTWSSVR